MTCRIFLHEQHLLVEAPFLLKDSCKAIAGARWQPTMKAWSYPPTPSAARALHLAFPNPMATWTDDAAALLLEAEKIAEAAIHKLAESLPPPPITALHPPLWTHQIQGYHFAKGLSAVMLAMQMRTGKTRTTIDILQNRGSRLVLVVCPNKVLEGEVWSEQFTACCRVPHHVMTLFGGSIIQRTRQLTKQVDLSRVRGEMLVVCMNYEAIWRGPINDAILRLPWDSVVLDEAHKIKSPGGKASMYCARLGDKVPHRMCLTGTPMAHSPLDVYGQYRFLDKGIYGTSFVNFRARYAVMGGFNNKQVLSYQNQEDLNARFYTIAYRVLTEDALDLPEKQDIFLYCQLSPYAKTLYDDLETEFVAEVGDGTVTAGNVLTRILRLQQLTGGNLQKDRDIETGAAGELVQVDTSKRELLAELLEDLDPEEPVVVYCRFHADLDAVHEVASVLGRTSAEVSGRKSELKSWQRGESTILAVQIQSGSEGNDFARAHYMVFYSVGASLYQFEQAYMRIRSGAQKDKCVYYYLLAKGTQDEKIFKGLFNRQDVITEILKEARR